MNLIGWLRSAWRSLRGGAGHRRAKPGDVGPSEGRARQAQRGASPLRHVHLGVDFGNVLVEARATVTTRRPRIGALWCAREKPLVAVRTIAYHRV